MRIPLSRIQLAVRAALAAGVSLAIARLLKLEHPIYALLAAVIVTDLAPSWTRQLGLRRLVATVVGGGCGAALGAILSPDAWAVGLSVLIAMLSCLLLRDQEVAKVAGYVCGIVVLLHGTEGRHYALYRTIETVLGIIVAMAISLVPKLIRLENAKDQGMVPQSGSPDG